jgi:hypothetical protein
MPSGIVGLHVYTFAIVLVNLLFPYQAQRTCIKHGGLDWRELRLVWSGDHHGQADWPPAEILDLLHVMAAVQVIR